MMIACSVSICLYSMYLLHCTNFTVKKTFYYVFAPRCHKKVQELVTH